MSAPNWKIPSLKRTLLLTGLCTALLPLAIALLFFRYHALVVERVAADMENAATGTALDDHMRLTAGALQMLPEILMSDVSSASHALSAPGELSTGRHGVRASVRNTETGQSEHRWIPNLLVNRSPFRSAGLSSLSDRDCTLFERVGANGDMVSVANCGAKRSKGDLRNAARRDGGLDAAIEAVLRKETYFHPGNDTWEAVAPIMSSHGDVIGMLAVRRPAREEIAQARALVAPDVSGAISTFAIYASQPNFGGLIFSTGANWDLHAADRNALARVARQAQGRIVQARLDAPGGGLKVRARYLPQLNWILAAGVSEQQYVAAARIARASEPLLRWFCVVLACSVLASAAIWIFLARWFGGRLSALAARLAKSAVYLQSVTEALPEKVGDGLSERERQATLERLLQSVRRLRSGKQQRDERTRRAAMSAAEFEQRSQETLKQLQSIHVTMSGLKDSSAQIGAVVHTVNEIAFQSRLVALNASIEAARAGSSGASFGVVADEFGKLAQRCAEASHTTTALLEDTIERTTEETGKVSRAAESMSQVVNGSSFLSADLLALASGLDEEVRALANLETEASAVKEQPETARERATGNIREALHRCAGFWQSASVWLIAMAGNRKPSQ